jgi:hypothetical protein
MLGVVMKSKEKPMDPIPKKELPEWNELVEETRKVVNRSDKAQFDLILLAGRVTTKYGENRIKRWADEAGLSHEVARQYKWLAGKGVDQAFITKWARTDRKPNGLPYSVIRAIIGFAGSAKSPYALDYFQWAVDHKATAITIRAYMNEVTAPLNQREEAAKEIKMALLDKQEHEGFSDYLLMALERIVEEHPDAEDAVLGTVIQKAEDLTTLKIAAGIMSDEEEKILHQARSYVRKLKTMHTFLRDNGGAIVETLGYGHEVAPELKMWLTTILEDVAMLANAPVGVFSVPDEEMKEVVL